MIFTVLPFLTGLKNIHVAKFDFKALIEDYYGSDVLEMFLNAEIDVYSWSDLSRCLLLHQKGGVYMDVDTISVKQIPNTFPNILQRNIQKLLTNCFMKFEARHPFLKVILGDLVSNPATFLVCKATRSFLCIIESNYYYFFKNKIVVIFPPMSKPTIFYSKCRRPRF